MHALHVVLLLHAMLFTTPPAAAPQTGRNVVIPGLASDCTVSVRWIGVWPALPEGAFLNCGGADVFVRHPLNFMGHVHIETPEEALRYVRAFTSPESYDLFDLDGMMELFPGDRSDTSANFNVVSPKDFRKYLVPPTSHLMTNECSSGSPLSGGKLFAITRSVVLLNGSVYETLETVSESGYYGLSLQRVLVKDATKIGILHFGKI